MSKFKAVIIDWYPPIGLLLLIAIMLWNSDTERDFETIVQHQHEIFNDTQAEIHSTQKKIKEYIDIKASDRFTGTDGDNLENNMKEYINALKVETIKTHLEKYHGVIIHNIPLLLEEQKVKVND